jgi:MFS family permease
MQAGSWASIALIYFFGVLAPASLAKVIPMQGDLLLHAGATPQSFGLFVSMLMLPSAFIGTIGGGFIDRIGQARTLAISAFLTAATNLGYYYAQSIGQYQLLRIVEGISLVGVFTAAPALIMATTQGARRTRAMSLWTTYTPVGFSLGLLLAVPFAGTPAWKYSFLLHAALFAAAGLLGLRLAQPPAAAAPAPQAPEHANDNDNASTHPGRWLALIDTYRQIGPMRLALAFAGLVFSGFGISAVFPAHFAQAQLVSIGTASSVLAVCNLAQVAGSFLTGSLRVRQVTTPVLLGLYSVGAVLGTVGIFAPGVPMAASVLALCLWLLCVGGAMAVLLTTLPEVVRNPAQGAAAAGLLSQIAAIVTFITPPIWLPVQARGPALWWVFCAFVLLSWLATWCLLPRTRAAAAARVAGKRA